MKDTQWLLSSLFQLKLIKTFTEAIHGKRDNFTIYMYTGCTMDICKNLGAKGVTQWGQTVLASTLYIVKVFKMVKL